MKKPQIVRPPSAPKKEGPWISTPSHIPPGPQPPQFPDSQVVTVDDPNVAVDSPASWATVNSPLDS